MLKTSWRMNGEVRKIDREENCLLEEDLQFDHGHKAAPEITMDTTDLIEKTILDRIRVKLFDDVCKKSKSVSTSTIKGKDLPLNQEKSQISLTQVYEKDYLQAQELKLKNGIEESCLEEEIIKVDLLNLFNKLDALYNHRCLTKVVKEDVKIVTNGPAIEIEEDTPTASSEKTLLAPVEIKSKQKGELRASLERTSTDKKRSRRKTKKIQSIKADDKRIKKRPISKLTDELNSGVQLAAKSSEKLSSKYFERLQETVDRVESFQTQRKLS